MRLALTLLIFALVYGCSGAPYIVQPQKNTDRASVNPIYVVSHGWHTGLVVSGSKLNAALPDLVERFGDPTFYEIGWGDNGFYQAKKITTELALKAMFWATGAIVHVVAVPDSPYDSFPHSQISESCISDTELISLISFLKNSFIHDEAGRIVPVAAGIYGNAQFYQGTGRYHLFNTCNKWTAKGLSSAGFNLSPTFKLTASSVMDYLEKNRRACTLLTLQIERLDKSKPFHDD